MRDLDGAAPVPHVVRRGSGHPVLMLHGNGVDHRILLPLDAALEGAERIYVDLPGFGRTPDLPREHAPVIGGPSHPVKPRSAGAPPPPPGGLQALADWLVAAVPGLVGDGPFAVVGSSLGGLLARHLSAEFPGRVSGLALLAPVVDPRPRNRTRPPRTVLSRDSALLAGLGPADASEFEAIAVEQTPAVWERFDAHALPGIRAASGPAMTRLARHYSLREVPEDRGEVCAGPVLVVVGEHDDVVGHADQRELAERYPRAAYVAVSGAGHLLHLERPCEVGAALAAWLYDVRVSVGDVPAG